MATLAQEIATSTPPASSHAGVISADEIADWRAQRARLRELERRDTEELGPVPDEFGEYRAELLRRASRWPS
jgi:hypothetical protein